MIDIVLLFYKKLFHTRSKNDKTLELAKTQTLVRSWWKLLLKK